MEIKEQNEDDVEGYGADDEEDEDEDNGEEATVSETKAEPCPVAATKKRVADDTFEEPAAKRTK